VHNRYPKQASIPWHNISVSSNRLRNVSKIRETTDN